MAVDHQWRSGADLRGGEVNNAAAGFLSAGDSATISDLTDGAKLSRDILWPQDDEQLQYPRGAITGAPTGLIDFRDTLIKRNVADLMTTNIQSFAFRRMGSIRPREQL